LPSRDAPKCLLPRSQDHKESVKEIRLTPASMRLFPAALCSMPMLWRGCVSWCFEPTLRALKGARNSTIAAHYAGLMLTPDGSSDRISIAVSATLKSKTLMPAGRELAQGVAACASASLPRRQVLGVRRLPCLRVAAAAALPNEPRSGC